MAQETPPIILFSYPESVVGRRTEWYLTLRGIPYHVCRTDTKMPRPVLDRLGVHYRRIPVLAVGRDIYCDSRCILEHLERLYTASPQLGSPDSFSEGMERILESWIFDGGPFARTAGLIPADASLALKQDWLDDRRELTGVNFNAESLGRARPDALSQTRIHLQIVEESLLADGRKWLGGNDGPGISDVHAMWIFDWMMRPKERMGMRHAYPWLLNDKNYPKTIAWVDRMEEAFQTARRSNGAPKQLSDDDVVQMIESSTYWESNQLEIDQHDPSGLRRDDTVDLIALDSAPATGVSRRDVGKLAELTVRNATIESNTKNGTDVRIHYQRANARVAKAGNQARLTASEIPKL